MSIRHDFSVNDDLPINDMIRRAVRAEIESGANWQGATARLADFLDVSPRMIRARCRDEFVGASRRKRDLVEGCWAFLEMVAKRQAAWVERLARDITARRDRSQLTLPLEMPAHRGPAGSLPPRLPSRVVAAPGPAANEPLPARARSA